MDIIKFTLEGRFGFFKKPDVNAHLYFTYGNIHRVALLGIFGAILGYKGYSQMSFNTKYRKDFKGLLEDEAGDYPEFYERLNHLKVGIIPKEISFHKKIQVFNNSVGYACQEKGGNLIVKEQWIENPSWDIYIAIEDEEGEKLAKALIDKSFIFIPYLGKNDHPANIKNVRLIENIHEIDSWQRIDSLFSKDDFIMCGGDERDRQLFKYEEMLPFALEKTTNKYELRSYIYTNMNLKKKGSSPTYNVDGKNIAFI